MNRQKKFKKLFLLGIILISIISLTYVISAPVSAQEELNLKSISLQRDYAWDEMGMEDIQGNYLDYNSKEITTQTTVLQILKKSRPETDNYVAIIDMTTGHKIAEEICNPDGVTTINVSAGTFQSSHRYELDCINLYSNSIWRRVAMFIASDWEEHSPPTITASNRTVIKDDTSFNIIDGVSALDDEGNDITQNITYTGSVNIHKIGDYPVIYSVTDKNGLSTSKKIRISVKEETPSLSKPRLDALTDKDKTITGTATPNTYIYVILGTNFDKYRERVDQNGSFTIQLDCLYIAGTSIDAYIEDNQGNKSEHYYGIVQEGGITIGVNPILSSDTSVSGYTIPGAQVEVEVDNTRSHIFNGTADALGKYNVGMQGLKYPAGTSVLVTATLNGHTASKATIINPKRVSIDTIKAGDSIIRGEADPNAVVFLSVHSKNYQFKADAAGNFKANIAPALVSGDKITVYQISNYIKSETIIIDVLSK